MSCIHKFILSVIQHPYDTCRPQGGGDMLEGMAAYYLMQGIDRLIEILRHFEARYRAKSLHMGTP